MFSTTRICDTHDTINIDKLNVRWIIHLHFDKITHILNFLIRHTKLRKSREDAPSIVRLNLPEREQKNNKKQEDIL